MEFGFIHCQLSHAYWSVCACLCVCIYCTCGVRIHETTFYAFVYVCKKSFLARALFNYVRLCFGFVLLFCNVFFQGFVTCFIAVNMCVWWHFFNILLTYLLTCLGDARDVAFYDVFCGYVSETVEQSSSSSQTSWHQLRTVSTAAKDISVRVLGSRRIVPHC